MKVQPVVQSVRNHVTKTRPKNRGLGKYLDSFPLFQD